MFLNKKVREKDLLFQKFICCVLNNIDQSQSQNIIADVVSAWGLNVPMVKRRTSAFDFMNTQPNLTRKQSNNAKSMH